MVHTSSSGNQQQQPLHPDEENLPDCPLCLEPFERDDLYFYPCSCNYQICRFCFHRLRTEINEDVDAAGTANRCPHCRQLYTESGVRYQPPPPPSQQANDAKSGSRSDAATGKADSAAQRSATGQQGHSRSQHAGDGTNFNNTNQHDNMTQQQSNSGVEPGTGFLTERRHLAELRVVQLNLLFVVGLPPKLADADLLKSRDYFGKFGRIIKVVVNVQAPNSAAAASSSLLTSSTTTSASNPAQDGGAGGRVPSASAYITFGRASDAHRALIAVNNTVLDGTTPQDGGTSTTASTSSSRLVRVSLGTTKHCSQFLKGLQCTKTECMYLHEVGNAEASFTKAQMQEGRHQEYEQRVLQRSIQQFDSTSLNTASSSAGPIASSSISALSSSGYVSAAAMAKAAASANGASINNRNNRRGAGGGAEHGGGGVAVSRRTPSPTATTSVAGGKAVGGGRKPTVKPSTSSAAVRQQRVQSRSPGQELLSTTSHARQQSQHHQQQQQQQQQHPVVNNSAGGDGDVNECPTISFDEIVKSLRKQAARQVGPGSAPPQPTTPQQPTNMTTNSKAYAAVGCDPFGAFDRCHQYDQPQQQQPLGAGGQKQRSSGGGNTKSNAATESASDRSLFNQQHHQHHDTGQLFTPTTCYSRFNPFSIYDLYDSYNNNHHQYSSSADNNNPTNANMQQPTTTSQLFDVSFFESVFNPSRYVVSGNGNNSGGMVGSAGYGGLGAALDESHNVWGRNDGIGMSSANLDALHLGDQNGQTKNGATAEL